MRKCNNTASHNTDSDSLGVSRSGFRRVAHALGKFNRMVNPNSRSGRFNQNSGMADTALGRGCMAFLADGKFTDWLKHIEGQVSVAEYFMKGVTKLKDVGRHLLALGGRNYFLQACGGGMIGNAFEKSLLWPNRMLHLAYNRYISDKQEWLLDFYRRWEISPRSEKGKRLGQLMEDPSLISTNEEAAMVKEMRGFLDLIHAENKAYRARVGREEIGYRSDYWPRIHDIADWQIHFAEYQEKDIETDIDSSDLVSVGPTMRRKHKKRGKSHTLDPTVILNTYVVAMAKDIFHNEAARHNNAHMKVLQEENARRTESGEEGLDHMVGQLKEYTQTQFQGKLPWLSEKIEDLLGSFPLARGIRDAMSSVHKGLVRATFPFNWMWSLIIQPQSALLIPVRYSTRSTLKGFKLLFNSDFRDYVSSNVYAMIQKKSAGGRFSEQTAISPDEARSDSRYGRRGAAAEWIMRKGGGGLVNFYDRVYEAGTWLAESLETNLGILACAAASVSAKERGIVDEDARLMYMSDAVAKTQSMYNFEDRAGLLQARETGALMPFQSFAFEMLNTLFEVGLPQNKIFNVPRTGHYMEFEGDTEIAGKVIATRAKVWFRFIGGMTVANLLTHAVDDREPWQPGTFVPFASVLFGTGLGYKSNLLPAAYVTDLTKSFARMVQYGDMTATRRFFLRYHTLGGVQARRMIEGMEALVRGEVEDVKGRKMFAVEADNPIEAAGIIARGPWDSRGGKAYYEKHKPDDLRSIVWDSIKGKE